MTHSLPKILSPTHPPKHMHTHMHTCTHPHTRTHTHTHAHTDTHTHTCTHTQVRTPTQVRTHTRTRAHAHTQAFSIHHLTSLPFSLVARCHLTARMSPIDLSYGLFPHQLFCMAFINHCKWLIRSDP